MTLQEALDECSVCVLCNKNVSDEHKFQLIDKIMSTNSTKIHKVKFCNIITWLLKKVKWLEQQNEWHYPSKGEYPDDKTEMLVYFKYADYEYPCKTFGFYNGHFWETKRGDVSNKELIAWKEIIMPKER